MRSFVSLVLRNSSEPRRFLSSNAQSVKIVQVGARDGLQGLKKKCHDGVGTAGNGYDWWVIPTEQKKGLIKLLADAGMEQNIEASSFVSLPQFSDSADVVKWIGEMNKKGADKARDLNVPEVAAVVAVSKKFTEVNMGCKRDKDKPDFDPKIENWERVKDISDSARENNQKLRGYISTAFEDVIEAAKMGKRLLEEYGAYEISFGDTHGTAEPDDIRNLYNALKEQNVDIKKVALHLHNRADDSIDYRYERMIRNLTMADVLGFEIIDAAIAGLGGCPNSKGAGGNVPAEDVVRFYHSRGKQTGLSEEKLRSAVQFVNDVIGIEPKSKSWADSQNKASALEPELSEKRGR
ncbi:MAG: hydroxymethylglutaryl-CoA lyase [Rickettsiaceae bacterium]|nr:hydroxymethylglutaryl-CoA lyase [Rickettsiaceae bacterium]